MTKWLTADMTKWLTAVMTKWLTAEDALQYRLGTEILVPPNDKCLSFGKDCVE